MRRTTLVLMLALTAACGGSGASMGGTAEGRPAPRRSSTLVIADEIAQHGGHDLYEILRALRPGWFNTSPTRMTGGAVMVDAVAVYVDGRRLGTPVNLSEIPVSSVVQVRYYTASEAQGRFGLGNLQGAIDVITSR
jgi:hypothetical protein